MEINSWPTWRLVTFRFFLVYFVLITAVWNWVWQIPLLKYVAQGINYLENKYVTWVNQHVLHVKDELVPINGSGDTSYGWAQLYAYLLLAVVGCVLWGIIDRKRVQYTRLDYVLKLFLRYYVVLVSFVYGYLKIFAMQMPFPSLSAMATPLGDFLPMRLSWMFIGYSWPYQFFSGSMEILVGLLLLNKRSVTLGALLGLAVYAHVFILNISYDIPVKIFSFQLLLCCLYLVWCDRQRIINFFFLNKPVEPDTAYELVYAKKWHQWTRVVVKAAFIIFFVLLPLKDVWSQYKEEHQAELVPSMMPAWYETTQFVVNRDTLMAGDSLRWNDLIFDGGKSGSIKGHHPSFRPRYGREYFNYDVDTLKKEILFHKSFFDSDTIMRLQYRQPDEDHLLLWGMADADSIHMELVKNKHHFQLAEKQFHWLSEANR